ncbi:hypothetical protein [Mesorhizobium sp.]|uniref:hypothetical protein n=1 Tax=Mesorhizobium sp. TaxID=1871066 RepID=UPI00257BE9A4|nr:hypothetical protein [Mesorhizobium sp.]
MIDERLKNYWGAVRGLRQTPNRPEWLKGPFQLAITLEKDPRLRALLTSIHNEEVKQPA